MEKIIEQEKKEIKYFNLPNNEIAYPAIVGKRLGARLFDMFIIGIPSMIIAASWKISGTTEIINGIDVSIPGAWTAKFITMFAITLILSIINFFILPIFFWDGQTMGKKFLNIKMVQLDDKKMWQIILLRELPLALFIMLVSILSFCVSRDLGSSWQQYNAEAISNRNQSPWLSLTEFLEELKNKGIITQIEFNIKRSHGILNMISLAMSFVLLMTITFSPQKRGMHDMYANTVIIDGIKIFNKDEYNKMYHMDETTMEEQIKPIVDDDDAYSEKIEPKIKEELKEKDQKNSKEKRILKVNNILSSLNEEQIKVVTNTKTNIRIIAGPGSGKTRTITHKIAYLIKEKKIEAHRILGVTFTNKAAKEMKNRTIDLIGHNNSKLFTFHGLCANILYREHQNTTYGSDFHIIDRKDQEKILRKFYKEKDISPKTLKLSDVLKQFSFYSENNLTPDQVYENAANNESKKIIAEFYDKYLQAKILSKSLDFNDLISEVIKLFKNNKEVKERWSNYFDYIFVDEYQDTNQSQYDLLLSLKNDNNIINVVGDPDQNIYSFRGSNINFILNFEKDFKNTKTIFLSQNYRSNKSIVDVANNLIKNNSSRIEKSLVSVNNQEEKLFYYESSSKYSEARWVANRIESLQMRNPKTKIAILYRTNFASAIFESEMNHRSIPYSLIGSLRFAERKEVKEVISYILFLLKNDDVSFENIIGVPSRKIGPVALQKLNKKRIENKFNTIWEYLSSTEDDLIIRNSQLVNLITTTKKYKNQLFENNNVAQIIKQYLSEVGFIEFYKNDSNRMDNINEFLDTLHRSSKNREAKDSKSQLISFINENQLFSSSDQEGNNNVVLSTIHASKGLEYDCVFLVFFNEGILPSRNSYSIKDIEEERRVAYVAITRAKKYLYISSHTEKNFDGTESKPSSFIGSIHKYLNSNFDKKLENSYEVGDNYKEEKNYYRETQIVEGNIIYHDTFGKGVVLNEISKNEISVAFDNSTGIKEVLRNHTSIRKIK